MTWARTSTSTTPRKCTGACPARPPSTSRRCSRSSPLPFFRYHPDPVTTGAVTANGGVCVCCGRTRGWICTASFYTEQDVADGGDAGQRDVGAATGRG
ncbi:CbrC family protein [Streptomyces sp. QTS137]